MSFLFIQTIPSFDVAHAETNPDIGNRTSSPYSYLYGNGYWPTSSIREWLNSDDSVGNVSYTNEPPDSNQLGSQAYDKESGFLYEFTLSEKNAIAVTERRNFVYSTMGSIARDGGSGNPPRYDGLQPSDNIHISSPNIDKVWKNLGYQIMKEKVFILGTNEMFEYVQKRGFETRKGLSERLKEKYNISSSSYTYMTSTPNFSNWNSEALWGYNTSGHGTAIGLTSQTGIAPAIHLKPDYLLSNGKKARNLNIGEVVQFGTYDGARIDWKVINVTPEGYPLLWADKSVTLKRYDAPGETHLRNSESVIFEQADISIKDDLKFTNNSSDITPPSIQVVDDTALFERQNGSFNLEIKAEDFESGIDYIVLPEGNRVYSEQINYTFTENKRYYFTAVDKSGNHYGFEVPVGNINPPASVMITPSVNGWTNSDVTVNIQTSQANTDWIMDGPRITKPTMSGMRMPEYTTYAGKRYRVSGKVRLDTAKDERFSAIVRMIYRVVIPFGDNYRVSSTYPGVVIIPLKNLSTTEYTSFDNIITISGSYFDSLYPALSLTHGNIDRGDYSVEWKDIKVELLDKEDFNIEKIILPDGREIFDDHYTDTLSTEGTYTYKVLDSRGKITEKTIEVNIDKVNPDLSISGNISVPTNESIALSIKGSDHDSGIKRIQKPNGEWDSRSNFTYNIYENGTYSFRAEDYAGNITTKTVNISNIDQIAPTASHNLSPSKWTNQDVTVKLYISDKGGSRYYRTRLPNGNYTTNSAPSYTATQNGDYTFTVYDHAGNERKITLTVEHIDRVDPTITITPDKTEWTNQDVILSMNAYDADSGFDYYEVFDGQNGQFINVNKEQNSPTFPQAITHNKDALTGTLEKVGPTTLKSGKYTPYDEKTVTNQPSSTYNDGEYSGTLTSYVHSGLPADDKYVTAQTSSSYNDGQYSGTLTQYVYSGSPANTKYVSAQTSANYNSDGYTGTLTRYLYSGAYTPSDTKYISAHTSNYYNSGGYTGTLSKYTYSGSAGDSKYVTGQTSSSYNDGTYSGTLTQYVSSGSAPKEKWVENYPSASYSDSQGYKGTLYWYVVSGSNTASKTASDTRNGWSNAVYTCRRQSNGYYGWGSPVTSMSNEGATVSYSDSAGYKGTLYRGTTTTITDNGSVSTIGSCTAARNGWRYTHSRTYVAHYSGTVTKPDTRVTAFKGYAYTPDTRKYHYQGTVYKPDTRVYRYSGNVTKPASDTRVYRYKGDVSKPDTRVYRYRGTVYRPDTRVFRYQGTVVRPESDTRIWQQAYEGMIYKPGYVSTTSYEETYRAKHNGRFTFKVYDKAGNMAINYYDVTNIDKEPPSQSSINIQR